LQSRWDGELDEVQSFVWKSKAARGEKDAGLDSMPWRDAERLSAIVPSEDGRKLVKNPHGTVKPLRLLRYLAKLITPPNGVILTHTAGVGSEMIAGLLEGRRSIGIELNDTDEEPFVTTAKLRIEHWLSLFPQLELFPEQTVPAQEIA
jgi:site-specific DNA-methyltransferase (adenine-specific)